jgi:N-acetylglucosaminyl-diphospho-decaprenol L-rhamnosyltransferase
MTGPRVTAVIVTYRSEPTIRASMGAARRCLDAGLMKAVVVDNLSGDGTREILEREAGWATVILNDRNLGFGRGCNAGLARVETPYVLFLNPDAVIEPEAVATLVEFLDSRPSVGIVAPATIVSDTILQMAGGLPTPWAVIVGRGHPRGRRREIQVGEAPFETDWVCGAVLMAPTGLMKELGGFDPRFFLYFEETDLCRRVLDRGRTIWATGTAVARHVGGASSAELAEVKPGWCNPRYFFPSRFYYLRKHHGLGMAVAAEIGEIAMLGLREVKWRLAGRPQGVLKNRLRAPVLRMPELPG